jgi:glycosyltransferase involved in cell wall biosynthesis
MKTIVFFIPNIERGGIEKNLVILANFFVKNNYLVEIYYAEISREILIQLDNKIILRKSNKFLKLFFIKKRTLNIINCSLHLMINLKKTNQSIIISMQDHPVPIIIGKLKKIKCIIRIANHPVSSLRFFNNKFKFYIKILIKLFFYQFANGIVCNSNSSKIFLDKFINSKIISIYNPLIFNKKIPLVKKINKLDYLLTVGRFEKQKNFYGIIEAYNIAKIKHPFIKLIIFGSGSEKNRLLKLVSDLKIEKNVIFKGYKNPKNFYLKSKIFILNSYFEGMPNVILEAFYYKIPVISSNCLSGPNEILSKNKFGYLVPVNDYKYLAKKINYVLENYNEAKKKSNLAYRSLDRFDYLRQCEKYKKFINHFF